MFHYTYEIVYQSGMRYIGSRTSKNHPEKDINYWGSSKHTPNDDTKEKIILAIFPTRKEAYEHEIYLHKYNKIASNPKYHNKAIQTSTGFSTQGIKQNPEIIKMLTKINKGKKLSKEHIEKIIKSKLGIPRSKETKEKIRQANLSKKYSEKHKKSLSILQKKRFENPNERMKISLATKGIPKTQEHKEKIGKANRGQKRTPEQCKTISNAKKGKSTGPRSQEIKDKQSRATKGKHLKYPNKYNWINTKTQEIRYATCNEMSDEFCLGFSGNFTAIIRKRYKSYHKWELNNEE